jgi:hypothetical protein
MEELKIPQMEWIRDYLNEHFPGQSLPERAGGIATVIIDVTDSHGRPKELRISCEFLQTLTKTTVQEYLRNSRIAEQIETVPGSVSIVQPL